MTDRPGTSPTRRDGPSSCPAKRWSSSPQAVSRCRRWGRWRRWQAPIAPPRAPSSQSRRYPTRPGAETFWGAITTPASTASLPHGRQRPRVLPHPKERPTEQPQGMIAANDVVLIKDENPWHHPDFDGILAWLEPARDTINSRGGLWKPGQGIRADKATTDQDRMRAASCGARRFIEDVRQAGRAAWETADTRVRTPEAGAPPADGGRTGVNSRSATASRQGAPGRHGRCPNDSTRDFPAPTSRLTRR